MIRNRILMVMIILGLASVPAMATAVPGATYIFTSDHCTGGCSTGAPNMGTIQLFQDGTNSVDVLVTLETGFGFVSTGAGADASFFFRLLGNPTITYSNIPTGWVIPNVIPTNMQAAESYAGD